MKRVPFAAIERLAKVVPDLVYDAIEHCGLARLTIDADGSAVRTAVRVEAAARGYKRFRRASGCYCLGVWACGRVLAEGEGGSQWKRAPGRGGCSGDS